MARTANCLETATGLPIALETTAIVLSTFNWSTAFREV